MGRLVSGLALALGLVMPAIAGEARAVLQVGITITGKDAHAAAGPKAGQKSALQAGIRSSAEK